MESFVDTGPSNGEPSECVENMLKSEDQNLIVDSPAREFLTTQVRPSISASVTARILDHHRSDCSTSFPRVEQTSTSETGFGKLMLSGEKLHHFAGCLKLLVPSLKNGTLTFFKDGVILYGTFYGQRIFVPITAEECTSYEWCGIPAVFLCTVDSRKNLLDVMRTDKKKTPINVTFVITGTAPNRILTQTIRYDDAVTKECNETTMIKYELWLNSSMFPVGDPDVSFTLSKIQMGKMLATVPKNGEQLIIGMKPEGGLYFGTKDNILRFDIDGSEMENYPFSPISPSTACLLKFFGKTDFRTTQKTKSSATTNDNKYSTKVLGSGSGKPFCVALEDPIAFKQLIQKLRVGANGIDLSFYLSQEVKMVRIRLHVSMQPCAFFFCHNDCSSISDLEAKNPRSRSNPARGKSPGDHKSDALQSRLTAHKIGDGVEGNLNLLDDNKPVMHTKRKSLEHGSTKKIKIKKLNYI